MGRLVKCADTGQKIDILSAYCEVLSSGRKKFWTSQQAYNEWKFQNNARCDCINKLINIMGYSPDMKLPTLVYKKLTEYEKFGYDVVYNTILAQESSIQWALANKQFNNEINKVQYLFAIIQNNFMTEYKKKNQIVSKPPRQECDDQIQSLDIKEMNVASNPKQATRNISKWLGEDI